MIRTRLLVIAAAALIALSGCGGSSGAKSKSTSASDISDLSVSAILAKAKAQVAKENNVSIDGSTTDSGNTIGIKIGYSGDDSTGSITVNGGVLKILKVGADTYFKADDAFWKLAASGQSASIIAKVKGRWVKAGSNSNLAELLTVADKSFIAEQMLVPEGKPSKGKAKKVNGVDCITLDDGKEGLLYVAVDNARPISISSSSASKEGVTFSYDAVDIPAAPAATDVIDESELG